MKLFQQTGDSNTREAIELALQKSKQYGYDIVVSSISGQSGKMILEEAQSMALSNKIVIVSSVSSAANQGKNRLPESLKNDFQQQGVIVVTAAHALSAGERGLSSKLGGVYPLEIMAHTLRTLGEGVKVCFECAVMALDAGAIGYGKPVIAMGGSEKGLDTAVVITPSYSAAILETKIHEIICKPGLL